jgi:hypothetical protein
VGRDRGKRKERELCDKQRTPNGALPQPHARTEQARRALQHAKLRSLLTDRMNPACRGGSARTVKCLSDLWACAPHVIARTDPGVIVQPLFMRADNLPQFHEDLY